MKLKTRPPKEERSNKKVFMFFLGGLIILIMVASAIDIGKDDEEGAYDYNGIKFMPTTEGWLAYLKDGRQVYIMTNPAELVNLTISEVSPSLLNSLQKLYISYNPEEKVRAALVDFTREIKLTPPIIPSCTVDVPQCAELPLKTCNDTDDYVGVIVFKESNETAVSMNNNCLTIEGKDLLKTVDKLILEQI